MHRSMIVLMCGVLGAALAAAPWTDMQTPAPAGAAAVPAATNATNLGPDANGNPRRRALKTGHISNYDESGVGTYTLPDPLVLADGEQVRTADTWTKVRRAEIIRMYETQIFGRVPAAAPRVVWEVTATDGAVREGIAIMKRVVGRAGSGSAAPRINLTVVTPSAAKGRVPLILIVNFGGGTAAAGRGAQNLPSGDPPVAAEILARGWGYATVGYQDIQPDRINALNEGIIGAALAAGQTSPGPQEWGAISAWAWGVSRIIDYLETDRSVDASRIALQGFSRIGKTALWAAATDERIAAVFAACAGEMGSALSRRDYGETVDDMAQNFPWWFSQTFQQWAGRWNAMPVDAHMLIALSAPRPVFLTGGTGDQWADPRGEFLALVAAGPVYELLGKKGVGAPPLPPLDTAVIGGDLGWYYHTGGHSVPAADWQAFLQFLGKYFK